MTEQDPSQNPADAPVDPLYTHPASPFTQTEFGLSMLAYLMVLVGSVIVVQANPDADWRYFVALLPVAPAGFVIWLFVRALAQLDELQKRIQVSAFGLSLAATALITFGYGFLEGAGMPHLSWTYVLPLMALFWGAATAIFTWRYR